MKRYKITNVTFEPLQVTVTLENVGDFHLANDEWSSELKVGDTFGVMYDNMHGIVPVGYVYNGMVSCALPNLMKWHDRIRYKALARKNANKDWFFVESTKDLVKSTVLVGRRR